MRAGAKTWRQTITPAFALLFAAGWAGMLFSGCSRGKEASVDWQAGPSSKAAAKIKICYLGLTCEPAIFIAQEKGFFKDEGLDVELVKTDWASMRDGLADGRFQASYSFIMYLIKPIEVGLDLKMTGGIHTGCLQIQAGAKTNIKTVEDLKGKRLGITHMGSPPFFFASRVLADHGIDPGKGVEWVTMPADTMSAALDQGRVDAVANTEPMGTLLMAQNKVRKIADQATDAPYCDEYCCMVVLNGSFARDNPAGAAKVTRALLKGAKWVSVNPTAAARSAVEKNYAATTAEIGAQAIAMLRYEPGVNQARHDVQLAAVELQKAGFLNKGTDVRELADKAWLQLDGVTDEWVKSLQIEKVAGGGRPAQLSPIAFAALFNELCYRPGTCLSCCGDASDVGLPQSEEWARVRSLPVNRLPSPGDQASLERL